MDGLGRVRWRSRYRKSNEVLGKGFEVDEACIVARLRILKPIEAQGIAVWIMRPRSIQIEFFARFDRKFPWHGENRDGWMVAVLVALRGPAHSGRKIVLYFLAPSPDGSLRGPGHVDFLVLVGLRLCAPVHELRIGVFRVCPERVGLRFRANSILTQRLPVLFLELGEIQLVSAAPSAIIRTLWIIKTIGNQ